MGTVTGDSDNSFPLDEQPISSLENDVLTGTIDLSKYGMSGINYTISTAGAQGTTGSYFYTTAGSNGTSPSYSWNTISSIGSTTSQSGLHVKSDAEFEGDIKWKGRSLGKLLETIEDRLAILQDPDPAKLEKHAALKKAYDHYKLLEKLIGDD